MKPASIKFRLSLLIAMVLVSFLMTVSIVAYVEMKEYLHKNIDATLKTMAEGLLAELRPSRDDLMAAPQSMPRFLDYFGKKTTTYRIWQEGNPKDILVGTPAGKNLPLWLNTPPLDYQPGLGKFSFFTMKEGYSSYRALWLRSRLDTGTINILMAQSSYHADHEMWEFLRMSIILGGSLFLGALVVLFLIVSWGISPISRTAEKLGRLSYRNLSPEGLDNTGVPTELKPFVNALRDLLVRLNQAIQREKRFTADASHELRTPLTLIKSTLQTSRISERNCLEYQQAIDDALEDVERMEKLIEQLLLLARMDEAHPLMTPASDIPLDSLFNRIEDKYRHKISEKSVQIVHDHLLGVRVWGHEGELTQLFNNLLENALQYGPSNGTIRITAQDIPEGFVTIGIHDQGGPIAAKDLAHLFERFYRADSSRSHATGGSGLGLAIAREIALRHQGDIRITSEPQAGTTVWVRLPRSPAK